MMASKIEEKSSIGNVGARCKSCGGHGFRRSRLKLKDVWELVVLRYPVRCLSCSIRQTVPVKDAGRAVSSKVKQVRAAQTTAVSSEPEVLDANRSQNKPSMIGGNGSWAMPVHQAMKMPDLHGVTLQHTTSLPNSDETQVP